jgi:hypothetical protein
MRRILLLAAVVVMTALSLAGCASNDNANVNTTVTTNVPPPGATPTPATQNLEVTERPQKIKDMMAQRGEQDQASPTLKFVEPREGATINSSTVNLKLALSGDLKGYKPMKDPASGMGNHIHVILDNQPYEAYYNLDQPFELRNVSEGKHNLRVFASRPWHESYKNNGSFQMVTFTVKGGGGNASKPTTTNGGQVMADNKSGSNANTTINSQHPTMPANSNTASSNTDAPPREGKDMAASTAASDVDAKKPLLTYSRPKGEYKGADTEAIMIDFWLSNAKLQGDGGDFRVRYTVDGGEAKYIDKWEPIWLKGWGAGKHTVKLELVDKDGNVVANGDYNSTSREITITP